MKKINIEPNWSTMFQVSLNIVKTEIKDKGYAHIVTVMLEYGLRLHKGVQEHKDKESARQKEINRKRPYKYVKKPKNELNYPYEKSIRFIDRDGVREE